MSATDTQDAPAASLEQKDDSQVDQSTAAVAAPEGTTPEGNAHAADTDKSADRDEKGRFRNPAAPRIDELTRKHREAEREAAYWRGRALAGTEEGKAAEPPKKPTPDQFDDYGAYVEALTDWKAESKAKEVLDAREKATADKRTADERVSSFQERQEAARKALPDYDAIVANSDVGVAQHLTELLLDSEQGPQLAYHLAKNPDLAERLNAMPERQAAREIGRLEVQLGQATSRTAEPSPTDDAPKNDAQQAATPAARPRTTSAPAPVRPVANTGRGGQVDLAKAGMDEYVAARKAQGARWAR